MHGGGRRSSAVTYLPGFLSLALLLLVVAHVASVRHDTYIHRHAWIEKKAGRPHSQPLETHAHPTNTQAFLRPPAHAIAPRGSVLRPRPLPFVAVHHPTRAAAAAAIDSTTEAVAAEEEEEDWARSELSPGKRERRKRKAQRLSKGGGGGGIQGDQGRVEPSENKVRGGVVWMGKHGWL